MFLFLWLISTTLATPFPKDTVSFPYTAQKADFWVGWIGGTGCKRHWDILDFEDASHHQPFDKCGQYVQVSMRFHKWVDYSVYQTTQSKFFAWPIKGDGILTKALCESSVTEEVFRLTQFADCGNTGKVLALCNRQGEDVSALYATKCSR